MRDGISVPFSKQTAVLFRGERRAESAVRGYGKASGGGYTDIIPREPLSRPDTRVLTLGLSIASRVCRALKRATGRGARSRVSMLGGAVLWQSCDSHRERAAVKRAGRAEPQGAATEGARTSKFPCLNSALMKLMQVCEYQSGVCGRVPRPQLNMVLCTGA